MPVFGGSDPSPWFAILDSLPPMDVLRSTVVFCAERKCTRRPSDERNYPHLRHIKDHYLSTRGSNLHEFFHHLADAVVETIKYIGIDWDFPGGPASWGGMRNQRNHEHHAPTRAPHAMDLAVGLAARILRALVQIVAGAGLRDRDLDVDLGLDPEGDLDRPTATAGESWPVVVVRECSRRVLMSGILREQIERMALRVDEAGLRLSGERVAD